MRNALVLIDYINEIVHPNGKISSCASAFANNNIIPKINQALAHARQNSWLIIWVKVGFQNNYLEVSHNSEIFSTAMANNALKRDTWGMQLIDGIDYLGDEIVIFKNRINAFYATNLELILRSHEISNLYLGGVSTEMAIQSTARDAHDKDFKVYVIEDLCASGDLELHEHSIKVLSRLAKIITVTQLSS